MKNRRKKEGEEEEFNEKRQEQGVKGMGAARIQESLGYSLKEGGRTGVKFPHNWENFAIRSHKDQSENSGVLGDSWESV